MREPFNGLAEEYGRRQVPLLVDGTDCRGMEALADPLLGCVLMERVLNKKMAGELLDGREWKEWPVSPAVGHTAA